MTTTRVEGTRRLSWGDKALILAGAPTLAVAVSGLSAGLPRIEAALAHGPEDEFLIKMLVGVVGTAMVIGAPLTGFLADRYGLRRVLFLNYLLFTVAGSAGLYLDDLRALVVARFLIGIGAAGAATASIILINRLLPPADRAQWMGAYIASAFIAALAMHPLVGLLAEVSWHYMFALCLAGAPFVLIALTAPGAEPARTEGAAVRAEEEQKESRFSWFPFRFAFLGLILGCIVYLPLIYTPFLLRDMGVGPAKTSIVLLGDALTGTVTALLFGRSRRLLSSNGTFVCIFATAGIGALVTALAPNYMAVMLGLAIIGLGNGWVIPQLMLTLGSCVKPTQQGRAAGIVKASNYISITLSVAATERLSQLHGPRMPIMISSALAFGLLLLVIYNIRFMRERDFLQPAKPSVA